MSVKKTKVDLTVKIGGVTLPNPVMTASGTFGYGDEYKSYININRLGCVITKTITIKPKTGNNPPRIAETECGMLNSIGLENIGMEAFISQKLPKLKFIKIPLMASIAGDAPEEYAFLASRLCALNALSGVELNLSCPNIHAKNEVYGSDKQKVAETVKKVKQSCRLAVIAKLSPNVADFAGVAQAAEDAGADAVTVANTYIGMAVDVKSRKPKVSNITAGYSGPGIKPLTLRYVWMISKELRIPVIASGGIMNANDALEFIISGAAAFQIGTASFVDPGVSPGIPAEIERYLKENGFAGLSQLRGSIIC